MSDWENPPLEPAPPPEPVPERYPFWTYLDFVLFISLAVPSFALAGLVTGLFLWIYPTGAHTKVIGILLFQFIGYLFWFAALYGLLKMKYDRPFWPSLAWTKPARGWLSSASVGVLLAFAVGFAGVLIRTPDIPMPIKDLLRDRFSLALVGVFGVTLGPLCEELAFRGFLLPLLVRSLGAFWGIFLTALPFALLHGSEYAWEWRHILLILAAGLAFGWMRHRSGSTAAATLMHATYNFTQFIGFMSQGK